jgi:hypothetical protein
MRRAVTNNCRTKLVFNPEGSDDTTQLAQLLHGIDKNRLNTLGNFRAAIQKPAEKSRYNAVIFDTYPPWNTDHTNVGQIKERQTAAQETRKTDLTQSLGTTANAGGNHHQELLTQAKEKLEERGFQVNLLYQDQGDDKPDGHVHLPTNETAHLEAEHSTLSKPAKVLKNLRRGHQQNREVIFAIETGNREKLENIVSDPVNRNGNNHQDQHGSYSYYTQTNGEPVSDIDQLQEAEYRIIEIKLSDQTEPECPELEHSQREILETDCFYRNDHGFCIALETECVLLEE